MIYKAFTIASSFKTVERVEIKEAGKVKGVMLKSELRRIIWLTLLLVLSGT